MTTAQPATQRPAGSVTAGRDYNHVRRNRFEFCVYDAADILIHRETGFTSKAQALRAAQKYIDTLNAA